MATKELKLTSDPSNITLVEKFIDDLRNVYPIGDDSFGNILISLTEAANNAIIHGNKANPEKQVEIKCEMSANNKMLICVVKDQGPGFDYNNLPDPTAPENIERTHGRGVFLMMQLADMVIFSDNGATVEMQFRV